MFNITNTLHEDVLKEIIEHAQEARFCIDEEKQREQSILLADKWKDELMA